MELPLQAVREDRPWNELDRNIRANRAQSWAAWPANRVSELHGIKPSP